MPHVNLKCVSKVFSSEVMQTYALNNVDLQIERREFVCIIGVYGCDKSTLLSTLGTLDSEYGGEHHLDGIDVSLADTRERTKIRGLHIEFIFQAFNVIGGLRVVETVEAPLTYHRQLSKTGRRKRALAALEEVGMANRANHFPHQLSGGHERRVTIAHTLAPSRRSSWRASRRATPILRTERM